MRTIYNEKLFKYLKIVLIVIIILGIKNNIAYCYQGDTPEQKEEVIKFIEELFTNRNKAIISKDLKLVEHIYDRKTLYGTWAYEYEEKKMKYINNWEEKQGVCFIDIIPKIVIRKIKVSEKTATISLSCSTEYKYVYENQTERVNSSRIGTYHIMQLSKKDNNWVVVKEWYKDPFADSLNLENIKVDSIKKFILSQDERKLQDINERRKNVSNYGFEFCGAGNEEGTGFNYNKKYRNYNPEGGDCANFSSQMLFEGGKFRKNTFWNYDSDGGTRAWLNADGFKNYMVGSGRASVIAYGSYDKVYKASYKLLPGDFVAYEKKGDITHISMVTGADSRGYSLVTCHNTDRRNVPWDLGWNDKNIKFWLVRVHY